MARNRQSTTLWLEVFGGISALHIIVRIADKLAQAVPGLAEACETFMDAVQAFADADGAEDAEGVAGFALGHISGMLSRYIGAKWEARPIGADVGNMAEAVAGFVTGVEACDTDSFLDGDWADVEAGIAYLQSLSDDDKREARLKSLKQSNRNGFDDIMTALSEGGSVRHAFDRIS